MPDQSAAHTALVNECLLWLGQRDDFLVKRVVVGLFRRLRGDPTVYTIGTPGEADIQGTWLRMIRMQPAEKPVWLRFGLSVAIECKTGRGRLNPDQIKWRDKFESVGGLYLVAREADDLKKLWPKRGI